MKYRSKKEIEVIVSDLLQKTDCMRLPVPVDVLAHRLDLRVEAAALGEEVSGVLVVSKNNATIGYNSTQSPVRQRFTIAHEIGHYVLHVAQKDKDTIFIDKQYVASYKRDSVSSTGGDAKEIQANRFAASVLMPAQLVHQELETMHFDLADEEALSELAAKFEVSTQAMSIRLGSLGIFSHDE
jgi:Zn-dependent peptidase ImmA (M78 family)